MSTKTGTKLATHTQIADMYYKRHMSDLMYTRGAWHQYNNGVWNEMHDLALENEIWMLLREFEANGAIRPTAAIHSSVSKCLRARLFINSEYVDAHETLINLQNGVYSLDDNNLYPHAAKYYFTTQLPFAYDLAAQAPTWDYYLFSTFVKPNTKKTDIELVEFIQEAMGYSLTSDVSHHVMFWCYGGGSNGKGVLFYVLEQLAGESFFPLNIGLLRRNPYQLAELAGKHLVACSESSATDNLVDDAQIKALVGGDTMTARSPHQRPFKLYPRAKLWWSMNKLPAVADSSVGFWRRVRVVPFNRRFQGKERQLDLKDRLDTELSGIFNWAMKGLRELRKRGRFVTPKQVEDVTKQYKHESNPVGLFVEDGCKKETKPLRQSQVTSVYQAYKDWCVENGYKYTASRRFRNEMALLGYPAKWVQQPRPPGGRLMVFDQIILI